MARSKRPLIEETPQVDLLALINKGGSSPTSTTTSSLTSTTTPTNETKPIATVVDEMPLKANPSVSRVLKAAKRKLRSVELVRFQIRVPENLIEDVDNLIDARRMPTSRNAWIIEAMFEKLQRDQK